MNLFDQSFLKYRTAERFTSTAATLGAPLTVGSRSSVTAVQTSRSEDREATFSNSEEQRGFSVVRDIACVARSVASRRSLVCRRPRESVSVIWLAGAVTAS